MRFTEQNKKKFNPRYFLNEAEAAQEQLFSNFDEYDRQVSQGLYNFTGKQLADYDQKNYADYYQLTKKGFSEKIQPYEIVPQIAK